MWKYSIIFCLTMGLALPTFGQDDDFFLDEPSDKEDTESPTESTVFEAPEGEEDLSVYVDDIVPRKMMTEGMVIEYEPLRETDIMWQKRIWRVIDTREKMNQPFRYYDRPFFTILKDLIEEDKIKAFRDEKFKEPLEKETLAKMMNRIDTALVYDPETYEEQIKITENPIDPLSIQRYRIKEVWYFDKKTSRLKVRILGIAPILDKFDETTGEFLYEIPMFWVYYPKARHELARERVVSDFNDVAPVSWYDLFEQRRFSSYIYAESNALGLRLKDKFPDSEYDRLLESQKIKNELFNWEQDLWTY